MRLLCHFQIGSQSIFALLIFLKMADSAQVEKYQYNLSYPAIIT